MKKLIIATLFLTVIACQKKEQTEKPTVVKDEHSYSKPELAVVKHLDLDIKVDFDTQTISGKASWQIDNISKGNEIIFDENTLEITKVTLDDDEKETKFELGAAVEFHGKPLHITIEPNTTKVNIYYKTTKDAVALQWLTPQQPQIKRNHFFFLKAKAFGQEPGFLVRIHREFVSLIMQKLQFLKIYWL